MRNKNLLMLHIVPYYSDIVGFIDSTVLEIAKPSVLPETCCDADTVRFYKLGCI